MENSSSAVIAGVVVEHEICFTLTELSRACHADPAQLQDLVAEGVLVARGDDPEQWLFDGAVLQRARAAVRLTRDLELTPAGTAVVLDLLEQIEALRARLQQLE